MKALEVPAANFFSLYKGICLLWLNLNFNTARFGPQIPDY